MTLVQQALSASNVTLFVNLIYLLKYLKDAVNIGVMQGSVFYYLFTDPSEPLATTIDNGQHFLLNTGIIYMYLADTKLYIILICINYLIAGGGPIQLYEYGLLAFALFAQFLQDFPDVLTQILANFVDPSTTSNNGSAMQIFLQEAPNIMRIGSLVVMLCNYALGIMYLVFQLPSATLAGTFFGLVGILGVVLDFVVLIVPPMLVD